MLSHSETLLLALIVPKDPQSPLSSSLAARVMLLSAVALIRPYSL